MTKEEIKVVSEFRVLDLLPVGVRSVSRIRSLIAYETSSGEVPVCRGCKFFLTRGLLCRRCLLLALDEAEELETLKYKTKQLLG